MHVPRFRKAFKAGRKKNILCVGNTLQLKTSAIKKYRQAILKSTNEALLTFNATFVPKQYSLDASVGHAPKNDPLVERGGNKKIHAVDHKKVGDLV